MTEKEDQRCLQTAINELNNLLQVADESVHFLEPLCGGQPDAAKYFDFLRTSLDRAATVASQLIALVEGKKSEPAVASQAPAPATIDGIEISNPGGNRELIMLIDDEPLVNLLAGEMLALEGYRVVSATCPFRALEIFRKIGSQIALVILDFTIPIMNGAEIFAELQQIRPSVAVLLSSGYAEQSTVRTMLARGLRGFLPKPYSQQKLLSQVRTTLDILQK